MKNATIHWIEKNAVMIVFLLAACDPFKEDTPPIPVVNDAATDYYILPNTSTVIDLKAIVNVSFTSITVKVSGYPMRGTLTKLDEFLLKYDPEASFTEGIDQFKISFDNNGTRLKTATLTIHMKNDTTDFPCSIFAVEDNAFTKPNSFVSIKFLSNDRICGFTKSQIHMSIFSQPKNGKAELFGDSINYTPEQGFIGIDSMVYKITSDNNSKTADKPIQHDSYGIIYISSSEESCQLTLLNAYVLDLTDGINDPLNMGDCAGGYDLSNIWNYDKPCPLGTEVTISLVTQTNNSGGVCMGTDGGFAYFANLLAVPENDTAQYEICLNGDCKSVFFYIKRKSEVPTKIEWSRQFMQVSGYLSSIFFIDEYTGYVGGADGIFKTSDGGINWNKLALPPFIHGKLSSITKLYFIDANNGFAGYGGCGSTVDDCKGGLMKTTDGGVTWSNTELDDAVTSVFFNSPTIGFITTASILFDMEYLSINKIYKTTDGGVSWKFVSYGGRNDICFANANTGYASDFGEIRKTTDAGETWQEIFPTTFSMNVTSLAISSNFIYATYSAMGDGDIWRSDDGVNWQKIADCKSWNNSIAFSPSGEIGFAIGYDSRMIDPLNAYQIPAVYISNDSGATWVKETFDDNIDRNTVIVDVAVPSQKVAYMVTGDGRILKYSY